MKLSPPNSPYPLIVQTRWGVHIHSAHFIFLRAPEASNTSIFDWLGISGAELDPEHSSHRTCPCLWITRCAGWVHIADDLGYTQYYRPNRMRWLEELAKHADIFMMLAGDCDESYEFARFIDGSLVRICQVDSPNWTDRVVVGDVGDALPGEPIDAGTTDSLEIGFAIASSLGIDLEHRGKTITRYSLDNARLANEPTP